MSDDTSKRPVSKGVCNFCGQTIAKSGITRHLQSCKAHQAANATSSSGKSTTATLLHLSIEGTYANMYWMHIEIPAAKNLVDLDAFLRDIWLECCGHLSQFEIEGVHYAIDKLHGHSVELDFEADDAIPILAPPGSRFPTLFPITKRMSKFNLGDAIKPGIKFKYEYDFGSTTDLTLKVIGQRETQIPKSYDLKILARNLQPEIMCDVCGKQLATHLCTQCVYDGQAALCRSCAKKHSDDHYEMFLPIVNSPRTGECGYTGNAPDDWVFWE